MTELSLQQGGNKWLRYFLTISFSALLILTIAMNALAGIGTGPFDNNTGDISGRHQVCITPAGFTFIIWAVIYILLCLNAIYSISLIFRKTGMEPSWQLGGAVSNLCLLTLCLNLGFNTGWLFAWDSENMIAAAILLILIMITNTSALTFALISFKKAAPLLRETSKKDFWLGIFFLNNQAVYDMWTTIAAILNIVILIEDVGDDIKMDSVCIGALSFLLVAMIIYFILEQRVLMELANPIFTHYIVYIWAMAGVFVENKDTDSNVIYGLIIANLVFGCLMLPSRIAILAFNNKKNSIYIMRD